MIDPGALYEVNEEVLASLDGVRMPVIVLLDGFVDAGRATSMLAEHLGSLGSRRRLVTFDHDQLVDYRSRRPPMVFDANQWVSLERYELVIDVVDAPGNTFLLFAGPEPDSQWERATQAVLSAVQHIGGSELISAGSIPSTVPHTRPVLITEHATDPDRVSANSIWLPRITVPGSFTGMLEFVAGKQGMFARGMVAHLPHYLAQGVYVPGKAALLARLSEVTGYHLGLDQVAEEAEIALAAIETEVSADPELQMLVANLEEQYNQHQTLGQTYVPSLDEIGLAVEQFLAEQLDEEGD